MLNDWIKSRSEDLKKVWATAVGKADVPYFRLYDLRSTYEWALNVTQLLRHGDSKVFKKSQMNIDPVPPN